MSAISIKGSSLRFLDAPALLAETVESSFRLLNAGRPSAQAELSSAFLHLLAAHTAYTAMLDATRPQPGSYPVAEKSALVKKQVRHPHRFDRKKSDKDIPASKVLGDLIRAKRGQTTGIALANKVGFSDTHLANLEHGRTPLKEAVQSPLAVALGLPPNFSWKEALHLTRLAASRKAGK